MARALDTVPERLDGIDRQSMELILLLHRVTNVVVYDIESRVHRPAGWSWSAFRAVFTLWVSGPLEPSRLAELSGMSRQAVSSLVKTLEADGLIARSAAEHDARSVVLSLTPAGTRKARQVFRQHNLRESDWASTLTPDERATMVRLANAFAVLKQMNPAPDNVVLVTDGLPTQGEKPPLVRTLVSMEQREDLMQDAVKLLPPSPPQFNIVLLPMEGDPAAPIYFWRLARATGGSFLNPAKDWP